MNATVLCLVLLVAAPEGAAADTPAETPKVKLSFDWAPGFQASVTSTKTRTRLAGERSSRSATSRYTLRTEPTGDDLRIRFANPTMKLDGDLEPLPAPAQAQIVAQVADLMPDFVVTKSGEFKGIDDLPGFQERLQSFLAETLPKDIDSVLLGQIRTILTSEAFLNSRAAEQWNAVVGAWVGAELDIGEQYVSSSKEPVPIVPGQEVLMNYSFSAKRLLPCKRHGSERGCAELEMRSVADAEDSKRLIESFLASVAGGRSLPATPIFKTLEIENVILLVTEPEGLIPHSCTITRSTRGTVSVDGQEQRVEQVDETLVSFTYP